MVPKRKAKIKMGRRREKWPEEKMGVKNWKQEGAREETMEGYNWASQKTHKEL